MANVLVRNLEEKTHRELRRRAKQNGHSINAEIIAVLNNAADGKTQVGLGTQIEEWKERYRSSGLELEFEVIRDKTPIRYVDFGGPEFDRLEKE